MAKSERFDPRRVDAADDPSSSLRAARARYFEVNRFGADGGYSLAWVPVTVLGVSFKIPNSAARVRAVRFHDLHHVLTGYGTDFAGEAEIGVWEIASGCANHPAALVLNLFAAYFGVLLGPRRLVRAFARGRATRNLYRATFDDALLDRTVDEVRRELGLEQPPPPAGARDVLGFMATWLLAAALSLSTLVPIAAVVAAAIWAVRSLR